MAGFPRRHNANGRPGAYRLLPTVSPLRVPSFARKPPARRLETGQAAGQLNKRIVGRLGRATDSSKSGEILNAPRGRELSTLGLDGMNM